MSKSWRITLVVFSFVGLTSGLLSIGRYQGTRGEQIAIVGVAIVIIGWSVVGLIAGLGQLRSRWRNKWGPILRLAKQIHALQMSESQINYVLNVAARHGHERAATVSEIRQLLISAPMLASLSQPEVKIELEQMASELANEGLVSHRWHQEGPYTFEMDFDWFRFASISNSRLSRIKQRMREDILRRFKDDSFDSVIFVHRGNENYQMGLFFEELMNLLKCAGFTGFLADTAKRRDDPLWMQQFNEISSRKTVLLIDPCMVDCSLDDACDAIKAASGHIAGALILFEVEGIDPSGLRNYNLLRDKAGMTELRGQLVLDLRKSFR